MEQRSGIFPGPGAQFAKRSLELSPGTHTITWTYEKDGTTSSNQDMAFVRAVTANGLSIMPPISSPVSAVITLQDGETACFLSTYCVNDCDPTDVELVSRQCLTTGDICFPRHIATSTGQLILMGPGEMNMYDPAASARRYLNKKPLNVVLPTNYAVIGLFACEGGQDIFETDTGATVLPANSVTNLRFRGGVTFISNFTLAGLSNPPVQNIDLLTPPAGRTIVISYDVFVQLGPATNRPPAVSIIGDDGSGGAKTITYLTSVAVVSQQCDVKVSGKIAVSAARPLQIRVQSVDACPISNGAFSLAYLFDV